MIPIIKSEDNLDRIYKRSSIDLDSVMPVVKGIIDDVKHRGDEALIEYGKKFDRLEGDLTVGESEYEQAYKCVSQEQLSALRRARNNILEFHMRDLPKNSTLITNGGVTTGVVTRAVDCAGLYVPGGKASYPSSVLMCAMAAAAAGVKKTVMCCPAPSALTLVAAKECNVNAVFKIGGAQAIAAMAYGTRTVPRAAVIAGPGNIYVTAAKKAVFGDVNVDLLAGPSEIVVIADKTANADFVCCDLLSQAEHDELAAAILLTDDENLALAVRDKIDGYVDGLKRKEIARKSLDANCCIVLCKNIDDALEVADKIAPEHLELCVKDPYKALQKVNNAGSVFLGSYTPEPVGDYYAGTNHVLPTGGTARSFSGLSAAKFIKSVNVIDYNQSALLDAANDIITLADSEGLTAHALSVKIRKQKSEEGK